MHFRDVLWQKFPFFFLTCMFINQHELRWGRATRDGPSRYAGLSRGGPVPDLTPPPRRLPCRFGRAARLVYLLLRTTAAAAAVSNFSRGNAQFVSIFTKSQQSARVCNRSYCHARILQSTVNLPSSEYFHLSRYSSLLVAVVQ